MIDISPGTMTDMVKAAFSNKQRFSSSEDLETVDKVIELLGINATWDSDAECYKLENKDRLAQVPCYNTDTEKGDPL